MVQTQIEGREAAFEIRKLERRSPCYGEYQKPVSIRGRQWDDGGLTTSQSVEYSIRDGSSRHQSQRHPIDERIH